MTEPALKLAPRAVPFVDLSPIHRALKDEILAAIGELIDDDAYTNGSAVAEFEGAFAHYCGPSECIGLASGLDALRLGLLAAGIEPGDEVIVPANTFFATVEAVTQAGGRPVVADVSEADYNLDPEAAAEAITERTRFLMPVHLYGQLADMPALSALAARHGLKILEDACQAHGAERDGFRAGAGGLAAAFSFYPSKNLGAMGDAGALVTDDPELSARVRALREHGQTARNRHSWDGYTARLDTIQAVVLLAKLPHLEAWTEARRRAAAFYLESLAGIGDLVLPPVPEGSAPVWHLFPVRTSVSGELTRFLADRQIATGRHYPTPVHLAPALAWLNYRHGAMPVSEALAEETITLPIYAGIAPSQLEAVVEAVVDFYGG